MMLVIIVKTIKTAKYNHKERMYTGQAATIHDNFVVSKYTSQAGEMTFVTEGVITCTVPNRMKTGDKLFYDKDTDKFTDRQGVLVGKIENAVKAKSRGSALKTVAVHFGTEQQCTIQREKAQKNKKDPAQTPVKKV